MKLKENVGGLLGGGGGGGGWGAAKVKTKIKYSLTFDIFG